MPEYFWLIFEWPLSAKYNRPQIHLIDIKIFTLNFSFLMHVTYPIFMAFTNSLSQMIKNLVTGDMNLHIYINVAIIKLRVL